MKRTDLEGIYAMACAAKGFQPNDAQFRLWWKALGDVERSQLEPALIDWFRNHEEFPMPSQLLTNVQIAKQESAAPKEKYQQQICPKCNGVVGMLRPLGNQFRTWCVPCQSYRKIVPEDQALTEAQWQAVCYELDLIYREWVSRGKRPEECLDPQVDRALAIRAA